MPIKHECGCVSDYFADRELGQCTQTCLPMARRPLYLKKSVKLQVEKLERKCRYCKTHQSARGFDKHEAWCKKTWMIRKELRLRTHSTANLHKPGATDPVFPIVPPSPINSNTSDEFVQGSSSMPIYPLEYPSRELDSQVPTTTTSSPSGMLIIILKCFFFILLGIFQAMWSWSCLNLNYRKNTLKSFLILTLWTQLQK